MIRTYQINNKRFIPVQYDDSKKTAYIPNELFLELYKATAEKLEEAFKSFSKTLGTDDFQIVCLSGDMFSQAVEDFKEEVPRVDVPVDKIFKINA